jgi:hypothetical protein
MSPINVAEDDGADIRRDSDGFWYVANDFSLMLGMRFATKEAAARAYCKLYRLKYEEK